MILLAEHDEPFLAAKKKQRHLASETATSTPKNRVWNFFSSPLGRTCSDPDLSAETATGSVQFSYETASGQAYYYTFDHLGSVREMLNGSGTIVARYGYNPSGVTTLISGSNLATFQWTGMMMHLTSGLYLPDFRGGYDPTTGRFIQRDQSGESGGLNLYGYCDNDPIDYVDPEGLCKTLTIEVSISSAVDRGKAMAQALREIAIFKQEIAKCSCYKICVNLNVIFDIAPGGPGYPTWPPGPGHQVLIGPTPKGTAGVTIPGKTIVRPTTKNDSDDVLSHEMGHQGGYRNPDNPAGNDHTHSGDPGNIMFPVDIGGTKVDEHWCKAIESMAQ